MCVSTCLKGGVGGRKSQRCQLFTVHCSRFRRLEGLLVVVDEGGVLRSEPGLLPW